MSFLAPINIAVRAPLLQKKEGTSRFWCDPCFRYGQPLGQAVPFY
jgi:hypothetical protein